MTGDVVQDRLVETANASQPVGNDDALRLLTSDFLACSAAGGAQLADGRGPGVVELAVELARRGSLLDLDDVDWGCVTHPGSVVLAAVLAASSRSDAHGDLASAVTIGYRVTGDLALILGTAYRGTWHATTICGVVGAAAAVSTLIDATRESLAAAMGMACLAAGGRTQAVMARNGAAGFNRQAAVSSAMLAALWAKAGHPTVAEPFVGAGGLIEALGIDTVALDAQRHGGPVETSLRLFPVTGFAHGAVLAASEVGRARQGQANHLRVQVAPAALRLSQPGTGGWWDVAEAARRAFSAGDPFACATPCPAEAPGVLLEEADLPVGAARVIVGTDGEPVTVRDEPAPGGVTAAQTRTLWRGKCARVMHVDPESAQELASRVLGGEFGNVDGSHLLAAVHGLVLA